MALPIMSQQVVGQAPGEEEVLISFWMVTWNRYGKRHVLYYEDESVARRHAEKIEGWGATEVCVFGPQPLLNDTGMVEYARKMVFEYVRGEGFEKLGTLQIEIDDLREQLAARP